MTRTDWNLRRKALNEPQRTSGAKVLHPRFGGGPPSPPPPKSTDRLAALELELALQGDDITHVHRAWLRSEIAREYRHLAAG